MMAQLHKTVVCSLKRSGESLIFRTLEQLSSGVGCPLKKTTVRCRFLMWTVIDWDSHSRPQQHAEHNRHYGRNVSLGEQTFRQNEYGIHPQSSSITPWGISPSARPNIAAGLITNPPLLPKIPREKMSSTSVGLPSTSSYKLVFRKVSSAEVSNLAIVGDLSHRRWL